jgi:hypothetical protein
MAWNEGVTPLWTAFHLYNYFWRYFGNWGVLAGLEREKAGIFNHGVGKLMRQSADSPKGNQGRVSW